MEATESLLPGFQAMAAEHTPGTIDYACTRMAMSTDGLALVSVSGEVDVSTAPRVLAAANDALRQGARAIFIDLAKVTFFGAAGATALLAVRRQCCQQGAIFALLRPSRPALRVLDFTDLMRSLK
jgi:anti-anti-sigma factor